MERGKACPTRETEEERCGQTDIPTNMPVERDRKIPRNTYGGEDQRTPESRGRPVGRDGFRKGKSTLDPMRRINEIVAEINQKSYRHRKVCLMITFDIKNAFNSAEWGLNRSEVDRWNMCGHITRLVDEYLSRRYLWVGRKKMQVTRGVPQGSISGPLLWNIFYNRILNVTVPEGIELLGYADDLAAGVIGRDREELLSNAQETVNQVTRWMRGMRLEVAAGKSETVLLCRRRQLDSLTVNINGHRDRQRREVLGGLFRHRHQDDGACQKGCKL
jgi:hypothetical protein